MDQTKSPDELFEIKPDVEEIIDDDSDMIINDSDEQVEQVVNEPEPAKPDASAQASEQQAIVEQAIGAQSEDARSEEEQPEEAQSEETQSAESQQEESRQEEPRQEELQPEENRTEEYQPESEMDDFSAEFEEVEREEEDFEMLEQIGDSIVLQVDAEIENSIISLAEENTARQQDIYDEEDEPKEEEKRGFFARIHWWGYTLAGVGIVIALTIVWIAATKAGHGALVKYGSQYAADKVTYQPVEQVQHADVPDEKDDITDQNINPEDIEVIPDDYSVVTPEPIIPVDTEQTDTEDPMAVPVKKSVYNVLIVGEENIGSDGYRGRSDLIMIASINLNQKSVKLTSVMRDSLVAIPGYPDNRINAAYAIGGVSLLYDTLKLNLGVDIDNYMLVNFESFVSIVDALGGMDVEVTAEEATYLNTTNYISDPADRKIVPGVNHMNGGQVLGYCRIRNVGTVNNEYSDFGRTSRQRRVLSTIYNMASDMNYFGLMGLAGKCLPYVTTDMDAETIETYINLLLEVGMPGPVETYRIPVSGSFSDVMLREMLVTKIDLEINAKALRRFIYGDEE